MKVKVSAEVLEGLEFVRDSGERNMFEVNTVMRIASRNSFYKTALWIYENKKLYIRGIFNGFEAE